MYIIKLDFKLGSRPYYVRFNKDDWNEIYDPNHASQFVSRQAAKGCLGDMTSMKEYASIVSQAPALKEYNKWAAGGMVRRTMPYPDPVKNVPYDKNKHTWYDVIEWQMWHFNHEGETSYEVYKTWPNLYSIYKCLWDIKAYDDRLNKDGDYVFSFSMKVDKKTKFSRFREELNIALKYINYTNIEGDKVIDIFDRHLGEGGDFAYFHIHDNGEYSIQSRWGSVMIRSGDLNEIFEYWKKHRYYD